MGNPDRTEAGLVSVIVPCIGLPATVRSCLVALLSHTRRPWHLVAVARSDRDAIGTYLAGVRDAAPIPVEVVLDPGVRSLREAWKVGIAHARGEYVALVGPSVVVTDAWLDQLVALVGMDPAIGMVGPMSNVAVTPQRADSVPYTGPIDGLDVFARRWRDDRRGRWLEVDCLSGQCLLLKRGVLEVLRARRRFRSAGLKPRRLSLQARRAGFRLAVADDLYVHQDPMRRVATNEKIEVAAVLALAPAPPTRQRRRVTLTMIVRDEEANLTTCLTSAEGLFDEIVVVDTGSCDRTVEIARSFGARVFDFVWVDDFAAARNAALGRATGDYAFWLDADDVIDPPQRKRLAALLFGLRESDPSAYVVRCACDPDRQGGGGQTVVDHIRLFPLRGDVRWTYRVHEQILPALRRVRVPVRWSDVTVRHTGYCEPEIRRRKLARDEKILLEEQAERPGDPFVLFNLGSISIERGHWHGALDYLGGSLAASAPTDSIVLKLYALIARAHQMLGNPPAALAACAAGLALVPDDAELLFREAVVRRNSEDPAGAEACWRKILGLDRPDRFSSVDQGIYGHLTRRNLAALAIDRGDRAEAARLWAEVLVEIPGDDEARAALGRIVAAPTRPGGH